METETDTIRTKGAVAQMEQQLPCKQSSTSSTLVSASNLPNCEPIKYYSKVFIVDLKTPRPRPSV